LARLKEQVTTQATTIADVRVRNSELIEEGRELVEKKTNSDKELALMQQRVKNLDARVPVCTHKDLQAKITLLEQQLARRVSGAMEEFK
jgi:hypothetical protein